MSASDVRVEFEPWDGAAATTLRDRMDAELRPRYEEFLHDEARTPTPVAIDEILFTIVAFDGENPVGTVSLKRTGGYSEVKRVYVDPSFRRTGLASRLLAELEGEARRRGVRDLVLQTGVRQPEASALYEREGWTAIPPFGPYASDEVLSRCYAKPLDPLLLGVEISPRGDDLSLVDRAIEVVSAADTAGVDFVAVADRYLQPDGRLSVDGPTLAAFAAPRTRRVALVPVIATTHTEPFHVAKIVQTLDFVSIGRAGWQPAVETGAEEAALFGRKGVADRAILWAEADEAIEVATRLWDSWEDGAEIRDVETGRFIDRDRVHHIDFEGRFFAVKGPSIVPRSPQGQPPIVVRVPEGDAAALAVAAARADIVRVSVDGVAAARAALSEAGRGAAVVVDLPAQGSARIDAARAVSVRAETGADGAVVVYDGLPDARALADTFRGLRPESGGTFRERLGLDRPVSRYARVEASV